MDGGSTTLRRVAHLFNHIAHIQPRSLPSRFRRCQSKLSLHRGHIHIQTKGKLAPMSQSAIATPLHNHQPCLFGQRSE